MGAPSRRKRLYKHICEHAVEDYDPQQVAMGPFEGQPCEEPECVLHEMAHAALLGDPPTKGWGYNWDRAGAPLALDLWELRALGTELALAEVLGLPLYARSITALTSTGLRTKLGDLDLKVRQTLLERCATSPSCRKAANTILNLLRTKP